MEVKLNLSAENLSAIAQAVVEIQNKIPKVEEEDKNKLFTVNNVADMCNRTPWTIRQHIKNNLLIASKVGKSWLISQTNYQKYITNEQ